MQWALGSLGSMIKWKTPDLPSVSSNSRVGGGAQELAQGVHALENPACPREQLGPLLIGERLCPSFRVTLPRGWLPAGWTHQ